MDVGLFLCSESCYVMTPFVYAGLFSCMWVSFHVCGSLFMDVGLFLCSESFDVMTPFMYAGLFSCIRVFFHVVNVFMQ